MSLNAEEEAVIKFELEQRLYFIFVSWPDNPVPPHWWRDREGHLMPMASMGLDHLKASIRRAEKDLKEFLRDRSGPRSAPTNVTRALEPIIRKKIAELNDEFREKVDS